MFQIDNSKSALTPCFSKRLCHLHGLWNSVADCYCSTAAIGTCSYLFEGQFTKALANPDFGSTLYLRVVWQLYNMHDLNRLMVFEWTKCTEHYVPLVRASYLTDRKSRHHDGSVLLWCCYHAGDVVWTHSSWQVAVNQLQYILQHWDLNTQLH